MVDLTTISEAQVQSLVLKKKERKVGGGGRAGGLYVPGSPVQELMMER